MTPPIPRQLARRIRPAIAVNAALATAATALLAVGATGDAARLSGHEPAGNAEAAPPAQRQDPGEAEASASPAAPDDEAGASPDPTQPPGPGASPNSLSPRQDPDAALGEAVTGLLQGDMDVPVYSAVRLSVSVLAEDTGATATYGNESFDTASIVKVDILAALLLRAQDEGRELTASERALAEEMIRASDNDAADSLWWAIGGQSGLDSANERLGLTQTQAGSGGTWGLTQTTSEDQIALLRAVFGDADSALEPASQAYVAELMGSVIAEQQWGISAASEGDFELKNGWLPRSQTGRWDVNSIGRVTVDGASYLVAVVSDGHVAQADGIAMVEAAARAAVEAVSGGQ
jgi:hypothetical protein